MFGFDHEKGEKVDCRGIVLPSGETMSEPDENGYKYLGILEYDKILHKQMKEKVTSCYFKRLKLILKSKLNSKNLIEGINSWVVAVVRYSAAILDQTKEEIDSMDRKTLKFLTIYGAFHPKSNINRLYLRRKLGGRGLISIVDCVAGEKRNLHHYICSSEEVLLKFVSNTLGLQAELIEKKEEFKKRLEVKKLEEIKAMKLHGQFEKDREILR